MHVEYWSIFRPFRPRCRLIRDPRFAEIIIAKQRNGPIGTVQLKWLPELTKFANLAGAGGREG